MADKASFKRLKLYSFKLNALLEITQAINENLSGRELLKRYESILTDDLNIGRIAIIKLNEKWETILTTGADKEDVSHIDVEKELLPIKEISFVTSSPHLSLKNFDIIIPVITQDTPLAFVLIGDIDEEAEGISPTIKHLHFIQTISNVIIVAIENIRLHKESLRQEAMRKELELASRIQRMLIPENSTLPQNKHIRFTAFYHPHFSVGGDYYDCISLNNNEFGFCIADVSGKGISAAILMSNFQANLRALFSDEITLDQLVNRLNTRVMASAKGEKFITLFIGKYIVDRRELQYINAGHNPPLLYEENKKQLSMLMKGCVGMGMLDKIPACEMGVVTMHEPTKMFCYTDGLVELLDESGVESGIKFGTEKIEGHVTNTHPIHENINDIIESHNILEGNTAIFDDISILGIEFTPTS
jgi:sigma-B regulation protein RsbU (phosphoserine phosphatase)